MEAHIKYLFSVLPIVPTSSKLKIEYLAVCDVRVVCKYLTKTYSTAVDWHRAPKPTLY